MIRSNEAWRHRKGFLAIRKGKVSVYNLNNLLMEVVVQTLLGMVKLLLQGWLPTVQSEDIKDSAGLIDPLLHYGGLIETGALEPFFSTRAPGRGLGLPELWEIVRNHHGGVKVSSRPNYGSTFQMYLPAFSAAKEDLRPGRAETTASGPLSTEASPFTRQKYLIAFLAEPYKRSVLTKAA
jgi:hypothetical protein